MLNILQGHAASLSEEVLGVITGGILAPSTHLLMHLGSAVGAVMTGGEHAERDEHAERGERARLTEQSRQTQNSHVMATISKKELALW